jgi:hypothetical protein
MPYPRCEQGGQGYKPLFIRVLGAIADGFIGAYYPALSYRKDGRGLVGCLFDQDKDDRQ